MRYTIFNRTVFLQSSQRSTLPGLQDLKGQWSGGVQAYGGGGGATNVDFNVRGQSWQWGDYALDQARLLYSATFTQCLSRVVLCIHERRVFMLMTRMETLLI